MKEKVWRLDAFLNPIQFRGKLDVIGYAFSACLVDDKDGELICHILVCESDLEQVSSALIEWLERDGVFKEMKKKAR